MAYPWWCAIHKKDGGSMSCELCEQIGGELIWQNELLRVVRVNDPDYPGFCRVILNRHEAEMTDLSASERQQLMDTVFSVERVLRTVLQPTKINLASFGNMVPHVHWHVIPRYANDVHFPNPVWGARQRDAQVQEFNSNTLQQALIAALAGDAA